ncbi:MAG: 23S rRNA (uracil(1939)-C(5))-methyltransferase RlmD [Candidatus Gracilibacteria bacterium]|nr:23S rRNA (uracil(1939)-C(5))-methyltransferase RlmD [Candidatus Gracilibacteria bacterium]
MQQIGIKKGDILENIKVEKLIFGGKGYARLSHSNPDVDGRVIFITGGAIPGAIVNLKVLKKKNSFIETQIIDTVTKSPIEQTHPNNPYGECGGCKRVNIPYKEQLKIKQNQVKEAFNIVSKLQDNIDFLDIGPSPIIDGYRNKVEFSYGKFISHKLGIEEHFNLGFHKQGEFSKVQDYDGCVLIDEIQNEIYREIKKYTKTLGLPVYDQMKNEGFFRHLLIRRTYFTDEIMLLLSFNPEYFEKNSKLNKDEKLNLIKDFLTNLTKKYSQIKSIYLSHNPNKSDTCIGDLELIYGEKTIKEKLLDLTFHISPTSFFQTNSSGAEKLYSLVLDFTNHHLTSTKGKGIEQMTILDLYGGTGTIGMIFAKHGAKEVHSVELVTSASRDGEVNAKLNGLANIKFENKKVEDFLVEYTSKGNKADLLIIDPPRAGMHPGALPEILKFGTKQIIYVSCNPATLVRDLEYILKNSTYKIEKVKPVDMFPHTHHIETIVSLVK